MRIQIVKPGGDNAGAALGSNAGAGIGERVGAALSFVRVAQAAADVQTAFAGKQGAFLIGDVLRADIELPACGDGCGFFLLVAVD